MIPLHITGTRMSGGCNSSVMSEPLVLHGDHVSLVLEREASTPDNCVGIQDDTNGSLAITLSSAADLSSNTVPSVTISPGTLSASSLILTEDPISKELTVCQYLLPADIVGKFIYLLYIC